VLEHRFTRAAIKQAMDGEREIAVHLLREFSEALAGRRPSHPEIQRYVTNCLNKWIETDCDPKKAAQCFNVHRYPNRPSDSPPIIRKHIEAIQTFFRNRETGKSYSEAVRIAAECAHLSIKAIEKLVMRPVEGDLTVKQAAALFTMPARKRAQRK
jgi:hypothetical protein